MRRGFFILLVPIFLLIAGPEIGLAQGRVEVPVPSTLDIAKAIDQESRQLKDTPDAVRAIGVQKLLKRIRPLPSRFAVPLAWNLIVDQADGSDKALLQEMADALASVLREAPEKERLSFHYRTLAELARYEGVSVSIDDSRYAAAVKTLDSEEAQKQAADFTLTDLEGKQWSLKALRGKVVLVNFWATWCPPCRKEIPTLEAVYGRFRDRGLVILAISDEESEVVKRFVAEEKVTFPVLLDGGKKIGEKTFLAQGVPASFIFDRSGKLVAQATSMPTMERLLDKLAVAGLR